MSCKFKRIPNDEAPPVVCLPGWATDWRIFESLSGSYDILSPDTFLPDRYHNTIVRHLRTDVPSPIDLCGWSLGAYAAMDIACTIPAAIGRLVLVGVRPAYPDEEIQRVRDAVETNRQRCLKRFYRECFLPAQRKDYKRFRREYLPAYLDEMETDELLGGLDYLWRQSLPPDDLPECDIILIHGEKDSVAPPEPTQRLTEKMPGASFKILPSTGHAAFLNPQFPDVLHND